MAPGAVSARVILCHDPLRHSPRLSICSPLKKIFYWKASQELIHFYFHFHTFNFPPPLKKKSNQLSLINLSKFSHRDQKLFTFMIIFLKIVLRRSGDFSFLVAAILLRLHDRVRRAGVAARPPKFLRRWKLKKCVTWKLNPSLSC